MTACKLNKKLTLTLLLLGLFLPVFNAQASVSSWIFSNIAYPVVSNIFSFSLYIIFSVLGTIMGAAIQLLYWTVNIRVHTNVTIIQEGWEIMRDFANMLFMIALVIMAYGTIFNVKGYDFRSLIARFLIAALLINFSLVIGGLIIDGTQVLNNTFLNAMGDISNRLGEGLDVETLLPKADEIEEKGEALASLAFGSIITLFFSLFMVFVILVSVSVPLVVAIIRIPILWALLIVSPMAWLSSILPATKSVYDKWWHQFLGWTLFLPYYLFFLYFALYFLSKKEDVIAGLGQTFVNDKVTGLTGLQTDFTFQFIFFYALVAIFLIGGTKVAMSASKFSGTGIVGVAKWGRGGAMRYLGVTAAQRAAQLKLEEVKKEGLPGRFGVLYGGERGLERQTAKLAERFGITGSNDIQMVKEIGELKNKFARITDPAELKKLMDKGPLRHQLAVREVMKDRGLLNSDEYKQTFTMYGGNNTLAGRQFSKSIDYDKLSSTDREDWYKNLTDIESRRKVAEVMANKGEFDTVPAIQGAMSLYALPGEKANFLKKAARRITDNTTLRGIMGTGSDQEQLAVREILAERGALTGAEQFDTYSRYRAGSKEAIDFGAKVDFGNLSIADRQIWYNSAPDNEVKRKVAEVMTEKGDPTIMTAPALITAANLYTNDAEKIRFLEKAEKKNFMASIDAKAGAINGAGGRGLIINAAGVPLTGAQIIDSRLMRMKADALTEIGYNDGWSNPDFINAVQAKINTLQGSQPPILGGPPTIPGGPPIMPKPGGGERFREELQKYATDSISLAVISTLAIP